MNDKWNIYDLLANIVPGTLIVGVFAAIFPGLAAHFKSLGLPDGFAAVVLTALAIFAGNVVQAVGSLFDPLLFFTWTFTWGKFPSEVCLEAGLGNRYLPKEAADRIRQKMQEAVKTGTGVRSLFLYAMQLAESAPSQRVSAFNGLFAYHRALMIATFIGVMAAASLLPGWLRSPWTPTVSLEVFGGSVVLLALFWFRTKQRAFYYAREVLLTAERVLDGKLPATNPPAVQTGAAAPAAVPVNGSAH